MLITLKDPASFAPAWWLPGAHAQTLWGKFGRRISLPSSGYLERWDTLDGDFLEVFRVPAPAGAPRLLVLHGLEGTIRSHYARGILQRAAAAGWAADLLIFRSCGSELNRTPRFYHSGETGDLEFIVDRIGREHPRAPLLIVGYSLGGNVLLKWLGECGAALPGQLRAAAAVSVPYDLEAGATYIHQGFSRVYEQHFLRSLKAKAMAKLRRFPGLVNARALKAVKTLVDFDEAVTAPIHGFSGARDYYTRSSAIRFLPEIRRPTMLISAYDDPFLPSSVLDRVRTLASANPKLLPCFQAHGGHAGFVSGVIPGRSIYFSEDRIMAFFLAHLAA
ncbi:MAG: YheT family hydrolase [Gemmatimonadaceae bacterium]